MCPCCVVIIISCQVLPAAAVVAVYASHLLPGVQQSPHARCCLWLSHQGALQERLKAADTAQHCSQSLPAHSSKGYSMLSASWSRRGRSNTQGRSAPPNFEILALPPAQACLLAAKLSMQLAGGRAAACDCQKMAVHNSTRMTDHTKITAQLTVQPNTGLPCQ